MEAKQRSIEALAFWRSVYSTGYGGGFFSQKDVKFGTNGGTKQQLAARKIKHHATMIAKLNTN